MKRFLATVCFLWLAVAPSLARAAEIRVAVAANFVDCLAELAPLFAQRSGHRVTPIVGSTGRLFAQIRQGAPFDVFLAADARRPRMLVDAELALRPRVYARGRLVFWSADGGLGRWSGWQDQARRDQARVDQPQTDQPQTDQIRTDQLQTHLLQALRNPNLRHVAIANPDLAPYGRAADQTLESLGLDSRLGGRRVQGSSVGQVWQFAATGHAMGAFVAYAQVRAEPVERYLIVPDHLYQPIDQMAVLVAGSREPEAALSFLEFLAGDEAAAIIADCGYRIPESGP
ncbi:molybdate ABC transporter substrate-binding protein [bacterium DOLZORAL124_64_63]|nr:MAG: molybdate ABC transporter substrate-binding protein [bacterium DOLZORAL124_64_63]